MLAGSGGTGSLTASGGVPDDVLELCFFLLAYLAYFITACCLNFHRALGLVILTGLGIFILACTLIERKWGARILQLLSPLENYFTTAILCLLILAGVILWLVFDLYQRREQLVSLCGFCTFIILFFASSKHHMAVSWRTVLWGLALQVLLGVFIFRTEPGFQAFQFFGNQIQIFLDYTIAGSSFVFGQKLIQESFAFLALPIIVFFSSVTSILYYLGIIQWVILKISRLLQFTMNTTTTESFSVAGNIFLGMVEALLLIRPYLPELTRSEIHAVMTGGFSTIAGSVLGAYISFGIDASSLITASVMAAPCALAVAKLAYPEVEESKSRKIESLKISCGEDQNILEAAGNGAAISVGLVANIAANLIAFLAILAFINAALAWLGEMIDIHGLSFQLICSYVLVPVAFLLGASWEDAPLVAELLGIKFFLNEFVAYQQLSAYKQKRLHGMPEWRNTTKQWISVRSEIIATFALCGFANLGSTGIMLGSLSTLVPERKSEFSSLVTRALLTGACVSLLNACVAGTGCVNGKTRRKSWNSSFIFFFHSTSVEASGSYSFSGVWSSLPTNRTRTFLQQCCVHYPDAKCGKH
uniref:Sodium/nucleoside cotransporter n=1 Tax=Salvator merianae TaxID=96440 RepID=A0A8D0DNI6_SALMN